MKILIVTDFFLPTLGGVQRHTYTLGRYLSKLSHEVHIITSPSQNPHLDLQVDTELKNLHNIEVYRELHNVTSLPIVRTGNYLLACRSVAKCLDAHLDDYDLVHYHGTRQLFLRFVKSKKPIISSIHGIFPACALQSSKQCEKRSVANCAICHINQLPTRVRSLALPIMMPYLFTYYRLMEKSLSSLDKVVCVSEYVTNYLKTHTMLKNLTTIHNFIDLEEEIMPHKEFLADFDIRRHFDLPSNSKILTYFGSLSSGKGVDLLIDSFKRIHKVNDNVYLLIGGGGAQKTQLLEMAKGIRNIIFVGFVDRKIQLATLAQSDVFIHPARYPDACPTSILEAMAFGLPIITTRVGGNPELVIDGKGGYLVNPNSARDLSSKITSMLDNTTFQAQAKTFNRNWSRRFTINNLGPKIVNLYEKVCASIK